MIQAPRVLITHGRRLLRVKPGGWTLLAMTLPFFGLILLFSYAPLWGILMAFFDYFPGKPLLQQTFIGLRHFRRMLEDEYFYRALRNTLVLSGIGLGLSVAPVILALLLNELRSNTFKRFTQSFISFPNFISWIVVYSVFFSLLSGQEGAVTTLLKGIGILSPRTDILSDANAAWGLQAALGLWKSVGWGSIIYLSAITGIDTSLYEAARVDGAGRLQQAIHVTLPGLSNTYVVLLLLAVGNCLAVGFDQYYVFSNALVVEKLDVIDTYIFSVGVANLNFSYATAIGLARSVVSILLLLTANRIALAVSDRALF